MGLGKRPAALSVSDEALAQRTANLLGDRIRALLWEDRQIRAGNHRELTADEVTW